MPATLPIGAAFGVFTFFRLAGHFGQGGLIAFLVVLLGVTTAAQIACLVLGAMKSPAFPPVFIVLAVLSIVFAVIGMAQDRASLADIADEQRVTGQYGRWFGTGMFAHQDTD